MPWFIYLINGTNAKAGVQLGMSRSPVYRFAPVEADFAYTDAACSGTDDQGIVAVSYVDGTDYNGKSMSLIGAVSMTYDATKWVPSLTISAANSGGCTEDALRDAFATKFTMPVGQNGCKDATEVFDEGGAAATNLNFSPTSSIKYQLDAKGIQHIQGAFVTQATAGANAVNVFWYIPYTTAGAATQAYFGSGKLRLGANNFSAMVETVGTLSYINAYAVAAPPASIQANDFSDTSDSFYFSISAPAF